MTCKSCKTKFCWVCLDIYKNNKWSCGGAFDYCEKIAQTQSTKKNLWLTLKNI